MRKVNHFLGLRVPRGPCGFVWTFKRTLCRQSLWNFLCLSIKYSLGSPALVNIFREENRKPIQDVSDIEEPKEASQATFLPTSQLSLLLFRCLPPCPPPPAPPPPAWQQITTTRGALKEALLWQFSRWCWCVHLFPLICNSSTPKFETGRQGSFSLVGPACQDVKNNVDNIKSLRLLLREDIVTVGGAGLDRTESRSCLCLL